MSKGYIIGGGGSTKLYACIGVTYPSGSTCTCTNGTKTLKAKGTSGTAIFNVPSTGTWTVTATNGNKTASKSVSVTAEGQTEKVNLTELELYKNGTKGVTFTDKPGSSNTGAGTITWNTNNATFENTPGEYHTYTTAYIYTALLDLSGYDTLTCSLSSSSFGGSGARFVIGISSDSAPTLKNGGTISNVLASTYTSTSSTKDVSLDISSISSRERVSVVVGLASSAQYTTISSTVVMTSLIAQ
jgi:hypothetical protein